MSPARPIVVQRVRHIAGELLRSRDLRDGVAGEVELLWWHQRALHDAAGVVTGLAAAADGPAAVRVSAGVAYDPRGRELVLTQEATIDAPADGSAVLVLRRCENGPPALGWLRADRVPRCEGIVLARWEPEAEPPLQQAEVRARPTSRPRVASGATLPGATAWEPWLALRREGLGEGLEVRVDTTAAGFTVTPCYFAWLQWPRADAVDARPTYGGFGLQHVADETAQGFTFRVFMRPPAGEQPVLLVPLATTNAPSSPFTTTARTQRLSVAWLALAGDHDREGGA